MAAFEKASCHREVQWTKDLGKLDGLPCQGIGLGDIGAGPALCAYQEGIRKKFFHAPSSPKVGPKLGEQCRTRVPTSAGSGNLQPTLDEEPCAPSGARSACCLPLHLTVLQNLGERRDQVPGAPPVVLGDHAHHQVSPHSQTALAQLLQPRSMIACSTVPCIVPAPFYTISRGCSSMHTMVMTTIVFNTKGPTIFPLGALSTANRLDSLLAAWP